MDALTVYLTLAEAESVFKKNQCITANGTEEHTLHPTLREKRRNTDKSFHAANGISTQLPKVPFRKTQHSQSFIQSAVIIKLCGTLQALQSNQLQRATITTNCRSRRLIDTSDFKPQVTIIPSCHGRQQVKLNNAKTLLSATYLITPCAKFFEALQAYQHSRLLSVL